MPATCGLFCASAPPIPARSAAPKTLGSLHAADFRAFLAQAAKAGDINATRARKLSALRTFFRYLHKRHGVDGTQLSLIARPRPKRPLPKALTPDDALNVTQEIGEATDTALEQARDGALMMLLYGAGLRIAEALALNVGDLPASDDAMRVTGKGNKQRIVPLLPAVRAAIAAWLKLHPNPGRDEPLFIGVRGGRLNAGVGAEKPAQFPPPERAARTRHPARAAPQLRHPPAGGRGGSALHPGVARPCQPLHHPALYGCGDQPAHGRLAQGASQGLKPLPGDHGRRSRAINFMRLD